jgi:hypothetical protein
MPRPPVARRRVVRGTLPGVSITREAILTDLDQAGQLVERRVQPDGSFDGWNGRDVLCHLAAYTRVVAAILRSTAEHRLPTSAELYGRELTDQEQALTNLDAINAAVLRAYDGLSYAEALTFWRSMHAQAVSQAARLSAEQLAAPGPSEPRAWSRPHLAEVVTALVEHYAAHMTHGD